jgi:hypothetical protein
MQRPNAIEVEIPVGRRAAVNTLFNLPEYPQNPTQNLNLTGTRSENYDFL